MCSTVALIAAVRPQPSTRAVLAGEINRGVLSAVKTGRRSAGTGVEVPARGSCGTVARWRTNEKRARRDRYVVGDRREAYVLLFMSCGYQSNAMQAHSRAFHVHLAPYIVRVSSGM